MVPRHLQLGDGSLPCVSPVVEGHTDDIKSFSLELLVSSHNVRHLHTTRTAPRCPEVNQHVVALSAPLAQLVHLAVGRLHGQVLEHLPRCPLLYLHQMCLRLCQCRIVVIRRCGVEHLLQLVVTQCKIGVCDIFHGLGVVAVGLCNLYYQVYLLVLHHTQRVTEHLQPLLSGIGFLSLLSHRELPIFLHHLVGTDHQLIKLRLVVDLSCLCPFLFSALLSLSGLAAHHHQGDSCRQ